MNKISGYINHITYDSGFYLRNFEHDFLKFHSLPTVETVKRSALIALPFISLYKPAGAAISITMGGARVVTCLSEAVTAIKSKQASIAALRLTNTAIAVSALAGTVLNFQLGLLVSTTSDIGCSLQEAALCIQRGEHEKAVQEILQAASSMLHLAIMLSGSIELTLASLAFQGAIALYQAVNEFKQGRYPEFAAKLTMGMLKFNQANHQLKAIQRRNSFLVLEKYMKLMQQLKKGREVHHLIHSPLQESEFEIGKKASTVVLVDAEGKEYNFGHFLSNYGNGMIKGMNLQFRRAVIDGKNMRELDFKVNHVFRSKIQTLIEGLNDFNKDELAEFLTLTQSHAKEIKIEKVSFDISSEARKSVGEAYKVSLLGLGHILVGADSNMTTMYDKVRVVIEEDKSLYELHEMLSFLNLDQALHQASAQDVERLKIGQLYRVFFPGDATLFERTDEFFTLPIEELKAAIIHKNPAMKDILDGCLSKMEAEEILPGRMRYTLPFLSNRAKELGAQSLISTITGGWGNPKESITRLISMMKMGMLSTEMRFRNGINAGGLSPIADFQTGGADSVFTQLLTKDNFDKNLNFDQLNYFGSIRILISLDALNLGTYQYHTDSFGDRTLNEASYFNNYLKRPNILDFVSGQQRHWGSGNEVMIKDRLDPRYITGVVVNTELMRSQLIDAFRKGGLISLNEDGIETVLGRPLMRFIHVSTRLTSQMIA